MGLPVNSEARTPYNPGEQPIDTHEDEPHQQIEQ